MVNEGWNIIREAATWYFSNGYIWLLLIGSGVFLLMSKTERKTKYLVWYGIIYAILVFNPISVSVLSKLGMNGVYWRSFWMIPMGCIIACAVVELVSVAKKQIFRLVLVGLSGVAIVLCGKQIYTHDNFAKAENWYKIPQEVIEVSKCIEEGNTVLAPIDLMVWFRTYDADIYMPIGRQEYYFGTNEERKQAINALSWDETIDVSYVATKAIDYGCRYIVVGKEQQTEGEWSDYGYLLTDQTEKYYVYKR